jgi:hypothetical protein
MMLAVNWDFRKLGEKASPTVGLSAITVGIEPPQGREKTGAPVVGRNASYVLVTTDDR